MAQTTSDNQTATDTVDVDVHCTKYRVDPDSEAFETARSIRTYADPDEIGPHEFDVAYNHSVAGGELDISTLNADKTDVRLILSHVYSRLQGARVDEELNYDGSQQNSLSIGDIIVIDGRAALVGPLKKFPDLGDIEYLDGTEDV